MIRLFIGMLVALGLMLTPVAATAGSAHGGDMQDCGMRGKMPAAPAMPKDHSKMPCCTVACQAPWAAALLPALDAALPAELVGKVVLSSPPARQLGSISSSALDPPPRA